MRYDTQGVFIWIPSSWLLDACHFRSSTWKCTICNRANDIFLFYFFFFTTCNVRSGDCYEICPDGRVGIYKNKAFSHSGSYFGYTVHRRRL